MTRQQRAGFFAVVLAAWWAAAPALGAEESESGDLATTAAVRRHLEAWPEVSAVARDVARARLDPDALAFLETELARAFDPDLLMYRLDLASLARDPGALRRGWRESGAIGLVGPVEGLGPAALRDYPRFASQVGGGVPPARLRQVARIDASTGFGRNAWGVSAASARALARGARMLACDGAGWEARLGRDEVGDLGALAGDFQERVHVELLFHARDRSFADLERALGFLESPRASAFRDRLAEAIRITLAAATLDLRGSLEMETQRRCQ